MRHAATLACCPCCAAGNPLTGACHLTCRLNSSLLLCRLCSQGLAHCLPQPAVHGPMSGVPQRGTCFEALCQPRVPCPAALLHLGVSTAEARAESVNMQ